MPDDPVLYTIIAVVSGDLTPLSAHETLDAAEAEIARLAVEEPSTVISELRILAVPMSPELQAKMGTP